MAGPCCGGWPGWPPGHRTVAPCALGQRGGQQPGCTPGGCPAGAEHPGNWGGPQTHPAKGCPLYRESEMEMPLLLLLFLQPQSTRGLSPAVPWPTMGWRQTQLRAWLSPALTFLGSNVSGWGQLLPPDQKGTPGLVSWHRESRVRSGDAIPPAAVGQPVEGRWCVGCRPHGCWAHVLRREVVQQLGDGVVVAALPVLSGPAHAVLPVLRPLPQALLHLLQDLQSIPCRQLLRESRVSAKPGSAAAVLAAIPQDTPGGMQWSVPLSPSPAAVGSRSPGAAPLHPLTP